MIKFLGGVSNRLGLREELTYIDQRKTSCEGEWVFLFSFSLSRPTCQILFLMELSCSTTQRIHLIALSYWFYFHSCWLITFLVHLLTQAISGCQQVNSNLWMWGFFRGQLQWTLTKNAGDSASLTMSQLTADSWALSRTLIGFQQTSDLLSDQKFLVWYLLKLYSWMGGQKQALSLKETRVGRKKLLSDFHGRFLVTTLFS